MKTYLRSMFDLNRSVMLMARRMRMARRAGTAGAAAMLVVVSVASVLACGHAFAQNAAAPAAAPPQTPYEQKLLRLSEVLGAMHHLREICGAREGQLWREQMIRMLDAEAPSPTRRAQLVRNFNKAYRFHQKSFLSCTESASGQAQKFAAEGRKLSQSLALERANF